MRIQKNSWNRMIAVGVLCAFLPMTTTGCFGSFRLVKKAYNFNKRIDPDKWVVWFAFLLMGVVQIYTISVAIDTIFANSVEFWTGENPITSDVKRTIRGENGELATVIFHPDGSADVVLTDANGQVHALVVTQEGNTLAARALDGRLLARVGEVGGQPALIE